MSFHELKLSEQPKNGKLTSGFPLFWSKLRPGTMEVQMSYQKIQKISISEMILQQPKVIPRTILLHKLVSNILRDTESYIWGP